MIKPSLEKIIVRYITDSATTEDLEILSLWIEDSENRRLFDEYVQTHYAITYSMNDSDSKKATERFLNAIKKETSGPLKFKPSKVLQYMVAAGIIVALSLTYFLQDSIFNNQGETFTPTIGDNKIQPGVEKGILKLANGEEIILEKGVSFQSNNATSNGEELIYDPKVSSELVYNYLTIPRGGQFFLTLSDGTKIWLNSETQIKYPESFSNTDTRQVELIYGEAYFEVSPSSQHNGANFMVTSKTQNIEVIGTKFNVKAYKDEASTYTTLVEGKVEVNTSKSQVLLDPNQQSVVNNGTNAIKVSTVSLRGEIGWVEGEFVLQNKNLYDIMKVLSRWYDMEVQFENDALKEVKFVGIIRKSQKIEEILNSIKAIGVITDYQINNKTVILK